MLAAIFCIIEGLKDRNDRGHDLGSDSVVMYMAPTFEQAKGIFWPVLKEFARPVTASVHENTGVLTLINGVTIRLKGMDNPDRARGFKLRYAVLDEYADMAAGAWDAVIEPALIDVEGGALFIGTPKGKNHFYEVFKQAMDCERADDGLLMWEAFKFNTRDNPYLPQSGIDALYGNERLSDDLRRQELEADFMAGSANMLKQDWWKFTLVEPTDGYFVVAVDLQGFTMDRIEKKKTNKRDNTVISVVKIHRGGWWVKEQVVGQWDTRETSLQIILAAKNCGAMTIGIERGALMNAVLPYMDDVMAQYRRFFRIEPLTHGNQNKELRVQWSLQGRLEKGRIQLNDDPELRPYERKLWVQGLIEESADFPSPNTKDDRPDSLAYVDQIGKTVFAEYVPNEHDQWEPLDDVTGV